MRRRLETWDDGNSIQAIMARSSSILMPAMSGSVNRRLEVAIWSILKPPQMAEFQHRDEPAGILLGRSSHTREPTIQSTTPIYDETFDVSRWRGAYEKNCIRSTVSTTDCEHTSFPWNQKSGGGRARGTDDMYDMRNGSQLNKPENVRDSDSRILSAFPIHMYILHEPKA